MRNNPLSPPSVFIHLAVTGHGSGEEVCWVYIIRDRSENLKVLPAITYTNPNTLLPMYPGGCRKKGGGDLI